MKGPYILTASGGRFYFLAPGLSDIKIEDIAHALSNICRFGGHVRQFYSVAQHSVFVSNIVAPKHALAGLLHDAAEAYIVDVSSPLKSLLRDYKRIERHIERAVRAHFGIPLVMHKEVKHADRVALATERRDLMPYDSQPWPCLRGVAAWDGSSLIPLAPSAARNQFLACYNKLKGSQ